MSKETTSTDNENVFAGWENPEDISIFDDTADETADAPDNEKEEEDAGSTKIDSEEGEDKTGEEEGNSDADDIFSEFEDNTEEEEEAENTDDEEEEQETPKSGSKVSTLNYLKEKGLLDFELEEGEELTEERAEELLEDSYESTIEDRIAEKLQGLPPVTKSLVELAIKGGNEQDLLAQLSKNPSVGKITEDMDLDAEDNQKLVIETDLRAQGYDEDEIETQLEYLKDSGKMKTMSEKAHKRHIDKNKKQLEETVRQQEERKRKAKESLRNFKNKISENLKEIEDINGLKLSDKHKKDLPSYMSDPVVKTQNGNVSKFQSDLFNMLQDDNKAMALARLVYEDLDLSDVAANAKTGQAKKIKDDVRRKKQTPKTSGSSQKKARPLAEYFN